MRHFKPFLLVLLVLSLVAVVGACKKPPEVTPQVDTPPPPAPPPPPPQQQPPQQPPPKDTFGEEEPTREELLDTWIREGRLKTVYFAFDSSDLTEASRGVLKQNADFLKGEGAVANVVVEGHCDERGTIEYNLSLGERRAGAVRDYLVTLGVARTRIRIITYGEERPAESGHNEAAWTKNRRAEFKPE